MSVIGSNQADGCIEPLLDLQFLLQLELRQFDHKSDSDVNLLIGKLGLAQRLFEYPLIFCPHVWMYF